MILPADKGRVFLECLQSFPFLFSDVTGGSLWCLSMLTHSERRWVASSVSGPMILQADSMTVIISLTGRAVDEMAKFRPLCRIDSSCWFKMRSDLLITHLSLISWVSCSSTIGMRGRLFDAISLANLVCCRVRHFSHSALCACITQLMTSVCMSLGNDVNNSSFKSAINPLNVLILKLIYFILTFKSALCVRCMMLLAASHLTQVLTRRLTGVTLRCLQCNVKCRWF